MILTANDKVIALATLGIAATSRGDELVAQGKVPDDATLKAAHQAWLSEREAISEEPTIEERLAALESEVEQVKAAR